MKKREMLDLFSGIDDKFIDEAAPKRKTKTGFYRLTDLVACILIVALALSPLVIDFFSVFISDFISSKNVYDPLSGKNIVESHITKRETTLALFRFDDTTFEAVNELSTDVVRCTIDKPEKISVYPNFVLFYYSAKIEEIYLDVDGKFSVGDTITVKSYNALVNANEALSLVDQPARAVTYNFLQKGPYGENDYALYSHFGGTPIEPGMTYLLYLSDYNEDEGEYSEIGYSHASLITKSGVYSGAEFEKVYKNERSLMKAVREGLEKRKGRVEEVGRDEYLDELSKSQSEERQRDSATLFWIDDRKKKDGRITSHNGRIAWHWSDMLDYECFGSFEFNGTVYNSVDNYIEYSSSVGEFLGTTTASGTDQYTKVKHTVNCEVYEMKGVDSRYYVIAKIEGGEQYFAAMARDFNRPETLSEYIELLNPEAYMFITDVSLCKNNNVLERHKVSGEVVNTLWEMIKEHGDAKMGYDATIGSNGEYISFRVSSDEYGVRDRQLIVHSYGYIWTDAALGEGDSFKIGKSEAKKIINYVKENFGESLPKVYSFSIAGTVTEIGEDYFLIDDSSMMADPSEGMIFYVYMKDKTISRYFDGAVKVGSFIVVEYDGNVFINDGKCFVSNPLSIIHNARFSDDPNERNPE